MSEIAANHGRRLPILGEGELDDEQSELWAEIVGGRRAVAHQGAGGLVDPDGALIGPFNAWLHCPLLGRHAARLGEAVRFDAGVEPRLLELAIVVVAVHWRAEFELWAHARFAVAAGIEPEVIEALVAGRAVDPARDDEARVIEGTHELLRTGRWTAERFASMRNLLGERGVAELVTAIGYYTAVALNINAFEVPLPEGTSPAWPADAPGGDVRYLVHIEFSAADVPPDELEPVLIAERERGIELYQQGVLRDIWRLSERPGCSVGVWAAPDEETLRAILDALPIAPWTRFELEPIATHPLMSEVRP